METGLKLQQLFSGILYTTTLSVLVATPAFAQVIQLTGVRVETTPSGVDVILETDSETIPQVSTTSLDNTVVTDIFNAQLLLPDGQAFRQDNPVEGIAAVTVSQQSANRIRVTVTGTTQVPTVEVIPSPSGLVFSLSTPAATASELEEEIEIVVTRVQDNYVVPNATTGTRTDTLLRDIPQSIQVIPRQVLEDQQAIGVEEVVENVAGVTFLGNNDGRGLNFAIRGFQNVPVLRDGFRIFGQNSVEPEVANLEQIEVLKGPGSVLFGQAEPGGLINLVSKQPLSEPIYNLQFQGGNRDFISPSIDLSGPLTKDGRLLYRLNTLYRQEESIQDYDENFDRFFIGPTLSWQIGDRTDLSVSLEYIEDDDPAEFGTLAFGDGIADISPEQVSNNPEDTLEKEFLSVGYRLEHRFSENWQLRNQFRYISDGYDFSVIALPLFLDESTGILDRVFAQESSDEDTYTLYTNIQGKFNTGSIKHTLLFGVDLSRVEFDEDVRFAPEPAFFTPLDIFDPDYSAVPKPDIDSIPIGQSNVITTERLGIYLQDQIDILDNLILMAGLRFDIVDQDITDRVADSETNQYDDALTPRIGIVYQPIEPISLYASYSQTFTPNNSATDVEGDLLEPEEGEGFEVGIKADLIKDRLSATLAYFDITRQNVATEDPEDPFASVATGEQQSRGVDFDLIGEVLPGWNVVASYAFIDAEVTEDNTDNVGNKLFGVPKHSASLWTTYEIQSGDLEGLGFGLGFNFVGERQGDLANSFEVDSYFLTNAAVFYRRNRWQMRLNIENLFDVDFIEGVGGERVRFINPGDPFTVRASVSVKF
ncbi:MAG: TonB-dependent siderophore receptor [Symploca sp. SIO2B6]|nr:TonB-dependent siderophore receptor [Symploca sp. SIO2B6]